MNTLFSVFLMRPVAHPEERHADFENLKPSKPL